VATVASRDGPAAHHRDAGDSPLSGEAARQAVKDALAIVPMVITRIELWKTDRLVPLARNPRTHSDQQIAEIAASMREFGRCLGL
jgi:hypothetical protein